MNLFDCLPEEDVHLLWQYLDQYSGGTKVLPQDQMDCFLRYWDEAKVPFFDMFDSQFIIKKEVLFEQSPSCLSTIMDNTFYNDSKIVSFINNYISMINTIFQNEYRLKHNLCSFVRNYDDLVSNIYTGPTLTIDGKYTKDGRAFRVNSGCKILKMLGKIIDVLQINPFGYEEMRQAHSLVLNQKRIKGNLCLSIHPLDFLTMSDNASHWDSCMRWIDDDDDPGDYRLGTIEMMNSPCVVIAYIEAKEPMHFDFDQNATWNNKRWRQLFIVTRDLILGNRQYPYSNDELQGVAIQWLRSLCQKMPGWGPYEETSYIIVNNEANVINNDYIYFNIYCNYMYNDVYDKRLAYLSKNFNDKYEQTFNLNFSGPAVCTSCGDIIEYETVDPKQVQCGECSDNFWRCDCCGEINYNRDWVTVDGEFYCEWCAEEYAEVCNCCDELSAKIQHIPIILSNPADTSFDESYEVRLCPNCFDDTGFRTKIFGPLKDGHFNLDNITNTGLKYLDISQHDLQFLMKLRDNKDPCERKKMIAPKFGDF